MIGRVWHGWTTPANAAAHELLLKSWTLKGMRKRVIADWRGIQLPRRSLEQEVEFVTIRWFDSVEAVRTFAGEDHEVAVVPRRAGWCYVPGSLRRKAGGERHHAAQGE